MTWSAETSQGNEQDKIAHLVVPYLRGRALDLGCGMRKVWPSVIGVDNGLTFGTHTAADLKCEIDNLSIFADASIDGIFSSHALEDFPEEKVPAVLAEWARVLKPDGYLCLYVPSANLYPKVGEQGANPAHKWNILPGDIERHLLAATSSGWTQVECEERSRGDEYSLFEVYRKRNDGEYVKTPWERNPKGRKRCLVIRYGAIGDQIVASSVLPELRKQGWHITYNCAPEGQEIIRHDPYIDEFLIQDKDFVPNPQLGPYWEALKERYDQVVNLCESVEGALLALPGRLLHNYLPSARHKLADVNYLERTHDLANVPHNFHAKFYMTEHEQAWATVTRGLLAKKAPVIAWAINGSSPHKVYPWTQIVMAWLLERTPAHIVIMADPGVGLQLQDALIEAMGKKGADLSRVHAMAGKWKIRQSLSFCQIVDCVVGPETGPLNAVCMERVPKVIYLSHSSHENLTKHWKNTTALEPDRKHAPCWPCHMLHYTWEHCHQDEKTNAALCASGISPERVFEAIALTLGAKKAA